MKKNSSFLLLLFGLLCSTISFGQIVANDTFFNFGTTGGLVNLTTNTTITLNGNPVTPLQVSISLVSASNGLTLSGNAVTIAAGLAAGTYTLTYQVCEAANVSNCDTATLTIEVLCSLPEPIVSVQPNCSSFSSVIIYNLPTGIWSLVMDGGPAIQGNGSTYFLQMVTPGLHTFQVSNPAGCTATAVPVFVEPPLQILFNVVPQTCDMPAGTVMLENLPLGNWTLTYGIPNTPLTTVSGSGTNYTLTGLTTPDYYSFSVSTEMGCTYSVATTIGYLNDGISGTMTGAYVDYNNDGITNLGDVVVYSLAISNTTSCTMETVTYDFGNWQVPSSIQTLTNLAAGATTNVSLLYVLTQDDINNGSVTNWIALNGYANGFNSYAKVFDQSVPLSISDGIKLNAFFDTNNDGLQNNGEQNASLGNFTYQINSGISHYLYSQDGTNIIYESNPGNTYTLGYNLYNNCSGQYDVSTITYSNVTVASGSGITTYNFPISESPCQDIQLYLYNGSSARPGFSYVNYINYTNVGNQTMSSGTITFTKDSVLSIISVSEPSAAINANGFTFNFTNLLPGETRSIFVNMLVPTIPTVALGQALQNTASITIPPLDVNLANNTSSLIQNIVGSYDPNDKTESHGGRILHSAFTANEYLTYTLRFENTGTADAINILVNDILDSKLDETSVKMIRASHPYALERVGNQLTWRFDGVNLPPSVTGDAVTGHGYVVFQVKPKSGFALGDIIPNTASIYFDFNPAVVTNTCTTAFVAALATNTFAFDDFRYYPNPVKNVLTLSNTTEIDSVRITSVLGQEVLVQEVHDFKTTMDLSQLIKGIYFVKVSAHGQEKVIKISKD